MNLKEISQIVEISPIIPVVTIENIEDAVPLANALIDGGIKIMEVTLRTNIALDAINEIAKNVPDMCVGAGTVCDEIQMEQVLDSGAKFAFSPGISPELIRCAYDNSLPFIPGVATPSEIMRAKNHGIKYCKLFPASVVGGVEALKAYQGPFGDMNFCPTGGINLGNMNQYLALDNVPCIGGTWIVDKKLIQEKKFDKIAELCIEALAKIG
jgi:2-dehydro-3-deoxyphosphogluconate aldolase/(4S)-4-hydroxy-2-oxoglutarate aldolase